MIRRFVAAFNARQNLRRRRWRYAWWDSPEIRFRGRSLRFQFGVHGHLNISQLWGWEHCSYIRVWQLGLGFATVRLWIERN